MAIVREYVCLAHGDFDSTSAVCPKGCKGEGMVVRVFRTAPSVQSQRFRNINATFESLAREQGVTNMSNSSGTMKRGDEWSRSMQMSRSTELMAQHAKGEGGDVSRFFRPVGENMGTIMGQHGPLSKIDGHIATGHPETGYVPLNVPRPKQDGGTPFDGRNLGVPE